MPSPARTNLHVSDCGIVGTVAEPAGSLTIEVHFARVLRQDLSNGDGLSLEEPFGAHKCMQSYVH